MQDLIQGLARPERQRLDEIANVGPVRERPSDRYLLEQGLLCRSPDSTVDLPDHVVGWYIAQGLF